jgi:bifunctional non-homologous end joining protein LigD
MSTTRISGKKLTLTNLDKIYFPDEGYTKGDVIEYYDKVSKYIVKYLKDRPESLRRNPNGIKDEGFFHKDAGDAAPQWIDKYAMYSESADKQINYIMCNDKASLLYIANMGCIEINPWNSRYMTPDNPDYLVMDLDPSDNNTFDQVIEAANVVHDILERAECKNYCKTSGATGLHIYVPLSAKYDYEQARMFAEMIANLTVEQLSAFTSIERSLKKRGKGNIYIDYLQNKSGQTLSTVYSVRPKPGATVSTPLDWSEVRPGLTPKNFNIKNIIRRIEQKGDLFAGVLKGGINMEKALKKIGG